MTDAVTRHVARVSWLELLQDLVFVVLALSLFSGLHFAWGSSWVLWYAVAIVYVYGTWVAWVLLNNRFPLTGLANQLFSLAWITGLLIAATGTLWNNSTSSDTLAGGMAVTIAALGGQYVWAARTEPTAERATYFAGAFSLAAALLLALGAYTPVSSDVVIAVAPAVALVPLFIIYPRLLPSGAAIQTHHLQERFGQLILILMGDALLETVLNVERGSTLSLPGLVFAVALMFLVWRAYFLNVLPAGPPTVLSRQQRWMAAHLVIAVGVGFSAAGVAATASPLSETALIELEVLSEHVPLGVILGCAYLGFAWALYLAAHPHRRATVTYVVVAVVAIGGSFFLDLLDAGPLSTVLFLVVVLLAGDLSARPMREPSLDTD